MNGTGSRACKGLDPANKCMHDWKTFGCDWLLSVPGEKKTKKLRSPPNITSWRDFVSAEEIAQFLSRSFSSVRSSGSTVKQPS
jgi:hypothetical protein